LTQTAIPLAATVLLLREEQQQIEVLMTRRHKAMSFMGGLWVYPGGKLDLADCAGEVLDRLTPEARVRCEKVIAAGPLGRFTAPQALGLFVAACRETFEEVGILLARTADGAPCSPGLAERLQGERAKVLKEPPHFARLLAANSLFLDVSALLYWSHWITPSVEPRRFDTHFFVIPAPAGQSVHMDSGEAIEWRWLRPCDALAEWERGQFPLSPPTLLTLQEIEHSRAQHGSLAAVLAAEAWREVATIMPKIVRDAGHTIMPWHEEYDQAPGEGVTPGLRYPPHLQRLPGKLTRNDYLDRLGKRG
jgi:8-oxo-dGTP pyrophosphatase MutT (NUDIX family)